MPLDLAYSPEQPSKTIEGLIYALRHPATWPAGFEWNYAHCRSCAMGLAAKLYGLTLAEGDFTSARVNACRVADALSIDRKAATDIFCSAYFLINSNAGAFPVMPAHVATALENYLKGKHPIVIRYFRPQEVVTA